MAETNEEKRPPAVVYHALPEIEDTQRLVIAPEVDMLVDAVMEMANVTTEALQRAVEQFGRRETQPSSWNARNTSWQHCSERGNGRTCRKHASLL